LDPAGHPGVVVHGHALRQMSDDDLAKVLSFRDVVFASVSPGQKLRVVRVSRDGR
jgi:magnesium-transporting ATPase (P-type)